MFLWPSDCKMFEKTLHNTSDINYLYIVETGWTFTAIWFPLKLNEAFF